MKAKNNDITNTMSRKPASCKLDSLKLNLYKLIMEKGERDREKNGWGEGREGSKGQK